MNLTASKHNALHSLHTLLRISKVRVTRATLRDKLWQHPEFPSLTSLSDTLDELRVNNLAAHISSEQLAEIPLPALAYLRSEGGLFVPLRATTANSVEWWHHQRGWQKESPARFNQHWSGVALLIEPTKCSGEPKYAKSRQREVLAGLRVPFAIVGLLGCLGVWARASHLLSTAAPLFHSLLLVKLAGVVVSSLLVWYSLDANNTFLRSICQLNAHTNCGAILNTAAARLFSWLSWAEVGLFYFGGGLLSLLLFHQRPSVLYPLLMGMTLAALPYTFWSIYYQWRRAQQWCVLCLTVQGLLWGECGVLLYFHQHTYWPIEMGILEIALFISGFVLIPAIWALLKPSLKKALHTSALQHSLQSLKFDPVHLESLRQRSRPVPVLLAGMRLPTLGSTDAPHRLLVVTNPTCSVCARVHTEIEELMTELHDVCCQFVIAVSPGPGDVSASVAEHLLRQPIDKVALALHSWYTTLNLKRWLQKTPLLAGTPTAGSEQQVALHQQWCAQAGVNATPIIFFDGVEIPRYYTTMEVKRVTKFLMSRPLQLA